MQAFITIPVIDSLDRLPQSSGMLTHDEIKAELLAQLGQKKLQQVEVARALGIPSPRVAEIRKGLRRIQPAEMSTLAGLLGMASPKAVHTSQIPLLGNVAAGVWLEQSYADPDEQPYVEYDRVAGDVGTVGLFAVEPVGDSMDQRFRPNTRLICKYLADGLGEIVFGKYYIVEREVHDLREMTCKRVDLAQNGDFLLCSESSNPKYAEPLRIKRSTEDEHVDNGIRIIGRVIREVINYD